MQARAVPSRRLVAGKPCVLRVAAASRSPARPRRRGPTCRAAPGERPDPEQGDGVERLQAESLGQAAVEAGLQGCFAVLLCLYFHISFSEHLAFSLGDVQLALLLFLAPLAWDAFVLLPDWRAASGEELRTSQILTALQVADRLMSSPSLPTSGVMDLTDEAPPTPSDARTDAPAASSDEGERVESAEAGPTSSVNATISLLEKLGAQQESAPAEAAAPPPPPPQPSAEEEQTARRDLQDLMRRLQEQKSEAADAARARPGWLRVVAQLQDACIVGGGGGKSSLSPAVEVAADVLRAVTEEWFRFVLFLIVSGWTFDRLAESNLVDLTYLTTGQELPVTLLCQVTAALALVGLETGSLVLQFVELRRFWRDEEGTLQQALAENVFVKVANRGASARGPPGVDNEADVAIKRIKKTAGAAVLSKMIRQQQSLMILRGWRTVSTVLLSVILFSSTGSWVAPCCAVALQRVLFTQYKRYANARRARAAAAVMSVLKDSRKGTSSLGTSGDSSSGDVAADAESAKRNAGRDAE